MNCRRPPLSNLLRWACRSLSSRPPRSNHRLSGPCPEDRIVDLKTAQEVSTLEEAPSSGLSATFSPTAGEKGHSEEAQDNRIEHSERADHFSRGQPDSGWPAECGCSQTFSVNNRRKRNPGLRNSWYLVRQSMQIFALSEAVSSPFGKMLR